MADANKKAENAVRGADGQNYANKNGGCTWTYVASRDFYKNNCAGSGVGQRITVTSTQANGGTPITSKVSLADARSKAEQILDQRGQDYANQHGTCVWTGTGSATFYKDNCGTCKHGVALSVPYSALGLSALTSTVSQADADSKVQNAFKNDTATKTAAQAYANKNGDCADDDDTPTYGNWSYYCDGCTYRKKRSQTNPCSSASDQDEVIEHDSRSCGCGCDNTYYMDDSRCENGNSEEHYSSECDPTGYWRDGGKHCCNPYDFTIYTNEVCKGCSGECGDICVPDSPIEVVSAGEFCASSSKLASEQAYNRYKEYKDALQKLVDARICPSKVGNDDRWGNVKATNCPSNCTPKTISYKQIAGKYTACTKDEANRIADDNLQSDGISYANGLAQADRCDCVEPTKTWSWSVSMNNDCMSHEQLVTSRGFTITYNNQCGRSISGSVSGIGYTQNGEEQVNSASFTIPAGSGTKSGSVYFSREVVCGDVTISGHDSGNC